MTYDCPTFRSWLLDLLFKRSDWGENQFSPVAPGSFSIEFLEERIYQEFPDARGELIGDGPRQYWNWLAEMAVRTEIDWEGVTDPSVGLTWYQWFRMEQRRLTDLADDNQDWDPSKPLTKDFYESRLIEARYPSNHPAYRPPTREEMRYKGPMWNYAEGVLRRLMTTVTGRYRINHRSKGITIVFTDWSGRAAAGSAQTAVQRLRDMIDDGKLPEFQSADLVWSGNGTTSKYPLIRLIFSERLKRHFRSADRDESRGSFSAHEILKLAAPDVKRIVRDVVMSLRRDIRELGIAISASDPTVGRTRVRLQDLEMNVNVGITSGVVPRKLMALLKRRLTATGQLTHVKLESLGPYFIFRLTCRPTGTLSQDIMVRMTADEPGAWDASDQPLTSDFYER
jgi:hypothetical protein